jgi:hypothetical protein
MNAPLRHVVAAISMDIDKTILPIVKSDERCLDWQLASEAGPAFMRVVYFGPPEDP